MRKLIRILLIVLTVSINIGCDQVSKTLVRHQVNYGESIPFLNNHLTLTKVENTGAFLSLGDAWPPVLKNLLLLIFPLIAVILGFAYLLQRVDMPRLFVVGSSFIIGGGVGNIIDRIAYGSVTDFFHISFGIFQTGIFNMADVSIMTGVGCILLNSLLQSHKNERPIDVRR